jgi:hypothetical protein
MLAYRGTADREFARQLAHGPGAVPEQLDNAPSDGLAESIEDEISLVTHEQRLL